MREVKELILRYAPSDSPVLVLGESGTGKELVAPPSTTASRRRARPFVALNCGALPETLLESELFGAEKGAYTDAVARPGSFERADGGTLFLDEIGEMSPAAQTRLLRVIEQKELTRVGGSRPIPLDVRVVSATNRELKPHGGAAGGFRADLYYRLAFFPSGSRRCANAAEDIPLLAAHFLCALGDRRASSAARRWRRSSATPGRATCASFATCMERATLSTDEGRIGRPRPDLRLTKETRYSMTLMEAPSTTTRFSPRGVVMMSWRCRPPGRASSGPRCQRPASRGRGREIP